MTRLATFRGTFFAAVLLCTVGCAISPAYQRPAFEAPLTYRQVDGWVSAVPADALDRGAWWTLFNDPVLDDLAARVDVSNQTIASAAAAYAQALAQLGQQRAGLFPVVSLNGSGARSGSGDAALEGSGGSVSGSRMRNSFQASIGASWEPDVWGRLRAANDSAAASVQASAADLASARLAAQGALAVAYVGLRQSDSQAALLAETVAGYQRSLQIARNRYEAGIVARTDVLQAETQLTSAQADALELSRSRAQLENAIAVLVGQAPSDFSLAPLAQWQPVVPQVPTGVPSTLLQRRPDIAAAERRVAAAHAQVGIARSGYYPSIGLSGSLGGSASAVSSLFDASNLLWSLGVSAVQTLFDAGATRESVNAATAATDLAVAAYRQTVLIAFQNVEDQLAASRVLAQQAALRRQAAEAAAQVQAQVQNRYEAGQVSYTDVVSAQVTALNARRALVQLQADRQTTAVALIQALGGGWQAPEP